MKKKLKIVNVVGTRPQFVKMALLDEAARSFPSLDFVVVHTGQHYDEKMSRVFFRELGISRPRHNLGVGSWEHTVQVAKMIERLGAVLAKESPDMVFVYGDTNSTLAGALASAKMNIPLAHVEAGLRSFNRAMPEEVNRIVTDTLSDLLFCPTKTAVENLAKEGIRRGVFLVSDVMRDLLVRYARIARERSRILGSLGLKRRDYYLATVHRAKNTDELKRLKALARILGSLDRTVVFPLHPRTRKALAKNDVPLASNIRAIEPVSYIDMLALEMNAELILTDSGGLQKEAFFFRVPCVTLREETEWVETVQSGWNVLAGMDRLKISRAIERFSREWRFRKRGRCASRGTSARRMLEIAVHFIKSRNVGR